VLQAWQMKEADKSLKRHRAKHPHPTLDVHFLSLSVQPAPALDKSSALFQSLFPAATLTGTAVTTASTFMFSWSHLMDHFSTSPGQR